MDLQIVGIQITDNKACTNKKSGIVNKVFKTAVEMFE
jgi:hypothetical protein